MWNFVHDYINLCYSTKLLLMQLTRSIQRLCGSSKYFLDDKFKSTIIPTKMLLQLPMIPLEPYLGYAKYLPGTMSVSATFAPTAFATRKENNANTDWRYHISRTITLISKMLRLI